MEKKMKYYILSGMFFMMLLEGCMTTASKAVIWETKDIPRAYEVIGPVSVSEEISESMGDTIQGLAGYISRDGRVSGQMPPEMKAALDARREKYKDMIFEKLSARAQSYHADAVIGSEYHYVPAYATFSAKATVSAQGMMVKYKT